MFSGSERTDQVCHIRRRIERSVRSIEDRFVWFGERVGDGWCELEIERSGFKLVLFTRS
jgi:hypothetical protein